MTGLFERFPSSLLGIMVRKSLNIRPMYADLRQVFAAGMELVSVGEDLNSTAADLYRGNASRGEIARSPRPLELQIRKDR